MIKNELSVDRGMVLRGTHLVRPLSLRIRLVAQGHLGHLGIVKNKERLHAD